MSARLQSVISLVSARLEQLFRLPHSVSMVTLSQAFATPTSWDSCKWDLVPVRCIPGDDPFFKDRHCCDGTKCKLSVMLQRYSNGFNEQPAQAEAACQAAHSALNRGDDSSVISEP